MLESRNQPEDITGIKKKQQLIESGNPHRSLHASVSLRSGLLTK